MDTQFRQFYRQHLVELGKQYATVLSEEGWDAVVLHSGVQTMRSKFDDQHWPLRTVPHFQHWLPLQAPDCLFIVQPGRPEKLLWLREENFWERPPAPEPHEWTSALEIVELASLAEVPAHLPNGKVAFIGEEASRAERWQLPLNPAPLLRRLDRLRVKKTTYEVRCLAEANRRAALGHRAVAEAFRAGEVSEFELHLLYLGTTLQDDAETPYKNIVALGHNAATLHHISYGRERSSEESLSLLLDAGATCFGYASDITRTYVRGKTAAASAFRVLCDRTEKMQQELCAEVKVGLPYETLHERAHLQVGQILCDLKVLRTTAEEAVKSGLTRAFFPHGLGHSLGLQTHDVGCAEVKPKPENPFLRNTAIIAPQQVFTIEPGVYFIDSLLAPLRLHNDARVDWKLCQELGRLGGVRIEDDLVVGSVEVQNLTRAELA